MRSYSDLNDGAHLEMMPLAVSKAHLATSDSKCTRVRNHESPTCENAYTEFQGIRMGLPETVTDKLLFKIVSQYTIRDLTAK